MILDKLNFSTLPSNQKTRNWGYIFRNLVIWNCVRGSGEFFDNYSMSKKFQLQKKIFWAKKNRNFEISSKIFLYNFENFLLQFWNFEFWNFWKKNTNFRFFRPIFFSELIFFEYYFHQKFHSISDTFRAIREVLILQKHFPRNGTEKSTFLFYTEWGYPQFQKPSVQYYHQWKTFNEKLSVANSDPNKTFVTVSTVRLSVFTWKNTKSLSEFVVCFVSEFFIQII